jgi:large subunit ribosomal protein L19
MSELKGQELIKKLTSEYIKPRPAFRAGDQVKVNIIIKEGNKERIQVFEGLVLKKQNGGVSETFTVRKISGGIGVEKTFPIHSPSISSIDVIRLGKVRRAKLNYIRNLSAKAARIKERRIV